jgi:hypothetical protein
MDAGLLHDAINQVCPITGVSIGTLSDRTTWRFTPSPSATDQQKAAAQTLIDTWDISDGMDDKRAAKDAMTHTTPLIRLMRSSDRVTYKSVVQVRKAFNDLLDILAQGRFPTAQEKASLHLTIMTWTQAKQVVQAEIDTDDPNN